MRGGHQKPRQIINYDAGIVLIDLHQLNVKNNFRQYKSATLNTGQPHVNEEQELRRTTTRNIRFPNQMIEQINTAHKKGPGISQPTAGSSPSETNVRKRVYTSIKSDEEWTSRVLPSEQDDIVNSLNYEGIAVIELQFYHFPDSDRLRVGSVTD